MTNEQAESVSDVINEHCYNQLCFVLSTSMYHDPKRIQHSITNKWKANTQGLHFVFRVAHSTVKGKTKAIVSEQGESWGYFSFPTDMSSTQYGVFCGDQLPSNLLRFFSPIFEEVARLRGIQLTNHPPRPTFLKFQIWIQDGCTEGDHCFLAFVTSY